MLIKKLKRKAGDFSRLQQTHREWPSRLRTGMFRVQVEIPGDFQVETWQKRSD